MIARRDAPAIGALPGRAGVLRLVAAAALVALVVLGVAPAAGAHASLIGTEPAPQAQLDVPPTEIVLRFDEPVEASLGGIRLYDARERRIPVGEAERVPGADDELRAPIEAELGDGLYVVTWRATSADGHPVSGAFTFQVGDGAVADTSGLIERLLAGEGADSDVGAMLAVARVVGYVGLALLVGGFAFLTFAWPAGAAHHSVRVLLWVGWTLAVLGALGLFVLQGPYATGDDLGAALDAGLWGEVAETRTGRAALVRVAGAVAALVLVAWARRASRTWWQALAATTSAVLAFSVAWAGHAGTGRASLVGLLLGLVHVLAVVAWLGGLAYLVVAVLRVPRSVPRAAGAAVATGTAAAGPPTEPVEGEEEAQAVLRFSSLALLLVTAAVVTGVLQGWRLVVSWSALWDSDYGRLLLVKTGLVVAVLALAALARRIVRRRWPARRNLRAFVVGEMAIAAAVLVVTAVLAGTPPASESTSRGFFSRTLYQGDTVVSMVLDPAEEGAANELHVYVSPPGGSLAPVASVEARLLLPARDLGPIPVPLESAGPNHFAAYGVQLPFAGEWELELIVTTGSSSQRFATPIPVG